MAQANHSKNKIYLNYSYKFVHYTTGTGTLSFSFKHSSVRCCGKITCVHFENGKVNYVAQVRDFSLHEMMAFRMLDKHKPQQNTKDSHMSSVKIRTRHDSGRGEVPDL